MLFIIVGIINYLERINYDISLQRITDGLVSSVQSPDGTVKPIKSISIPQSGFNSKQLSEKVTISEKCIKFNSSKSNAYSVENNETSKILVNQDIKTSVFIKCDNPDNINAIPFTDAYSQDNVNCNSTDCPEFCCAVLFGIDFPR